MRKVGKRNFEATRAEYDAAAPAYDRRWERYLRCTHDVAMGALDLGSGNARLLDLACGTGKFLQQADASTALAVGVDGSHEMLRIARRRTNAALLCAPVESLHFSRNSFTHVVCLNSLHFFAGQKLVINRCRKWLEPGGRLLIVDWRRAPWLPLMTLPARLRGHEAGSALTAAELGSLCADCGFKVRSLTKFQCGLWPMMALLAESS